MTPLRIRQPVHDDDYALVMRTLEQLSDRMATARHKSGRSRQDSAQWAIELLTATQDVIGDFRAMRTHLAVIAREGGVPTRRVAAAAAVSPAAARMWLVEADRRTGGTDPE